MGKYDGKTVVITGGTSGFGLTTAEHLLGEGARVLATGHTKATLDAARERLGGRTLARELLPRGVRVNAVSPGPIDTGILERSLPAEAVEPTKAQMRETNPMKRFGRPEEIARAAVCLAFEATFTTGAELTVDGGASQL
jgi:NAD(P)-dependent dehydrogenase (short-subunit alcohol dehydrogenase family)